MSRRDGIRPRTGLVCVAAAMLAIAAACSEPVDPTFTGGQGTGPIQPPPQNLRDGLWAGTTAEGFPVQFTIDGGMIHNLSITIDLRGDCGVDSFKANVASAADAVEDQLHVLGDSANRVSLRGQFTDDATVSGSASLDYVGEFVDGRSCRSRGTTTWTASRNW
jgi:hypothetical protein